MILAASSKYCSLHGKAPNYITKLCIKLLKLFLHLDICLLGEGLLVFPLFQEDVELGVSPHINEAEVTRIFHC